jgi:rubrerythrin
MYLEMVKRGGTAGDRTVAQHFTAFANDEAGHHKVFKAMLAKRGAEAAN